MATPKGEILNQIDTAPLFEYIKSIENFDDEPPFEFKIPLKKKGGMPYQVGQREYSRSPGSRTWTEQWYDPESGNYYWQQGCDFLGNPLFWEEVEMCSGPNYTVQQLRDLMNNLTAEQVAAGYEHYYDLWTWEDNSERNCRLMEAFEAEHMAPTGTRIFDKVEAHAAAASILAKYNKLIEEETPKIRFQILDFTNFIPLQPEASMG